MDQSKIFLTTLKMNKRHAAGVHQKKQSKITRGMADSRMVRPYEQPAFELKDC